MQRKVMAVGGGGALMLAVAMALPGAAVPQDPGKAVFTGKGMCHACHGAAGKGTPLAPDLTDDTWVNFAERPTLEALAALVKKGVPKPVAHPAPMPPMGGGSLSDEELTAVARYVLSLSAPPPR